MALSSVSLRKLSSKHILIGTPRVSTTALRLLADCSNTKLANAPDIVCTGGCTVRNRSRMLVGQSRELRMCYWSLRNRSSSIKTIQRVVVEQIIETINVKSRAMELETEW